MLDLLGRLTRLESNEAMAVAEELLERSNSSADDALRVTTVEMAIALIQSYAKKLEGSSWNRVPAMRERLRNSDDGRLIVLASFVVGHDDPTTPNNDSEISAERSQSSRGRGGRRGRGRGR